MKNEHLLGQAREKKAEIQRRWRQKKKNKEPISDTPIQKAAKTARKRESEKRRKALERKLKTAERKQNTIRVKQWRMRIQLNKTGKPTEDAEQQGVFLSEWRAVTKAKQSLPLTHKRKATVTEKLANSPTCSDLLTDLVKPNFAVCPVQPPMLKIKRSQFEFKRK